MRNFFFADSSGLRKERINRYHDAAIIMPGGYYHSAFMDALPFQLTPSQKKVFARFLKIQKMVILCRGCCREM